MPVQKDSSGRRSVESEAEVPGTPEEVWDAIASGPGVTAWFVPCTIEQHVGGVITASFGPGMESKSEITAWDPPRRFAAENSNGMGPGSPMMATEWFVEARSGGTCLVRVVHSWFSDTDDWDSQFEGTETGWAAFFKVLRLYLARFRGSHGTIVQLMPSAPEPVSEAWEKFTGLTGLAHATAGQQFSTSNGAPRLAGVVEEVGPADHPELLLRLDTPTPGIAQILAMPMAGQVFLLIRLFFYGEAAHETAAREEPVWQEWLGEHFAPAAM